MMLRFRPCVAAAVAALMLVAGCAQQRIRDRSTDLMRAGDFERAVDSLDAGVREYPDSTLLRAGILQARNEALARLIAEAAAARAAGRLDDARLALERAVRFDTGGKRVQSLLADLAVERRQRDALAEAERLARDKQPEAALRAISAALRDNPRQPDLIALQRRLEAEQRQHQLRFAPTGLSETRPISLDFRDAGLRTVLDVVTRNSGVNFILDKDIRADIRVTVLLRSTRVEDAIDLIASTNGLAKKVIDAQTILIYPNTPEKQREHQEQVIRVFHLASAEAKGAAALLRSMLRVREPHVDERANMVVIRESPETIELAERLMALYDTQEPEVLLELEVIEIRSSRLTDLGVKFPDSFSLTLLPPPGASGLTLGNIRDIGRDRVGLGIGSVLVNFKREVGDFNTLANPRVRVRNREKAKVLVGDKVPVVTTTTGQGGFVSDSVNYLEVGLKLDVEPNVYADDEVAIKVGLEVSSVSREVQTASGSLAYQIGTRNASTLLRLRDGETQLLAGLMSNEDRSSASRVPGIGDLPLAGRLFSSQRDDSQRTELVLAITPRILRNLKLPDASQAELWIGTETTTRLRPVGGKPAARGAAPADAAVGQAAPTPDASAPSQPSAAQPAVAPPAVRWRGPREVRVGDVFSVGIELNSALALRGAPMQLGFDKDRLVLLEIEEGDYFRQGDAPTSFTQAVDAAQGQARFGVLRNQASGVPGQGDVVALRLRATAAGATELKLLGFEPIALGEPVARPALPQPLRIEVK